MSSTESCRDATFSNITSAALFQVNHSPSYHTDAKLDKEIKEALLFDTMTLVNFGALDKKKIIEEERKRIKERLFQKQQKKESKLVTKLEFCGLVESCQCRRGSSYSSWVDPSAAPIAVQLERVSTCARGLCGDWTCLFLSATILVFTEQNSNFFPIFFRPSATVSGIGLMESCTCHHCRVAGWLADPPG